MLHFRLIIIGFFMFVMTYFSFGEALPDECISCSYGYTINESRYYESDNFETEPYPNDYCDEYGYDYYEVDCYGGYHENYPTMCNLGQIVHTSYACKIPDDCEDPNTLDENGTCQEPPPEECPPNADRSSLTDTCQCTPPFIQDGIVTEDNPLSCIAPPPEGNDTNPPPPEGNDTNPPPPEGNNSNPPPSGDGGGGDGGGDGGDGGGDGGGGGGTGSTDNNQTTDGNTTNPPPTDGNTTNPPIGTGGDGGGDGDGTAVVVNGGKCDAGQIFCTYTNVCQFTNLACRPTSDCPDGYHPADNYETTGKCEQDKETTCKNPSTFFGRPFKGIMNQSACDKIKNAKGFICAHDHSLVACYYEDLTVPMPDTDDNISTDGDGSDKDYTAILKKINSNIKKDTFDTSDMLTQIDGTLKLNNSNNQKSLDAINKTLEVKLDTLNDSTVANNNKLANLINRMEVNTHAVQQNGSNAASQRGWMINQLTGLQNINKAINSNADKIEKNTKDTVDGLKDILDAINDKNITEGNSTDANLSKIEDLLSEMNKTINKDNTDDLKEIEKKNSELKEEIERTYTEFKDSLIGSVEIISGISPPKMTSGGGNCNLRINTSFGSADLAENLERGLSVFAPIFSLIINIMLTLYLFKIAILMFGDLHFRFTTLFN